MISSPLMTVMVDAARKAARSLRRDFGEVENLQVSRKGPGDFVSAADRKAEEVLRDALLKARPGYSMILEEGGVIEGTTRATPGISIPSTGPRTSCTRAALRRLHRVGARGRHCGGRGVRPDQGRAVHRRARSRAPTSTTGGFAWRRATNGGPPSWATARRISAGAAIRACCARWRGDGRVRRHPRMGSAALDLAYVACGRLDAYWSSVTSRPTISRAASRWSARRGVFVTSADGAAEPLAPRSIACGNESLHRDLLAILKKAQAA